MKVVNLSGGTMNVGGIVTLGGWASYSNSQQPATLALDAGSQFNMTGYGQRLDIHAGTYSYQFATTAANGAFSLRTAGAESTYGCKNEQEPARNPKSQTTYHRTPDPLGI